MVQRYSPKIRTDTAKNIAKNLLSTKTGKKVSDPKFKEFLKKDKDLKKFAYLSKGTTVTKHQAKKFFDNVMKSAKEKGQFKISMMAKKMGIKTEPNRAIGRSTLEKVYGHASAEELASQKEPEGPTPDQIRREQRKDKMLKTIHKQERAREMSEEEKSEKKEEKQEKQQSPTSVPRASGAALTSQAGAGNPSTTPVSSKSRISSKSPYPKKIKLLIFPIENQSINAQGLGLLSQKVHNTLRQTIANSKMFLMATQSELDRALKNLHLDSIPRLAENDLIINIAKAVDASLYITGFIKKIGNITELKIVMHNTESNLQLKLTEVKGTINDAFDLERKVGWQINNALHKQSEDEQSDESIPEEPKDLPI